MGVAQIWMQILFKVAQFWMPFNKGESKGNKLSYYFFRRLAYLSHTI